ncbi:RNA-dependent RNA polymerase [Picoa juniperi megatotivirus 1]|uniref:RNA-directed RNA polymerase n=1 Tax=Picoa juniperi megatotivirus 1 TaxID=2778517 RepID=A0A7L8Y8S3_9VIRU|nr:RNA-dependent RNA polymerase [Picoa juniperi megatotivirus 1]
MLDMALELECPSHVKKKLETNTLDNEITTYIRDNIIRFHKPGCIMLCHNPDEVPSYGNILASFSFPLFEESRIKELEDRAEMEPVAIPQDKWHNYKIIRQDRIRSLSHEQTIILDTRDQFAKWFRDNLNINVRFTKSEHMPIPLVPKQTLVHRYTKKVFNPPTWTQWQGFNARKYYFTMQVLNKEFPQGWFKFGGDQCVMMTHGKHDVDAWDGTLLGAVQYTGNTQMRAISKANRKTNFDDFKQNIRSVKDRKMNIHVINSLFDNFKKKQTVDLWFDQFKLDKLENNVIKTWNEETHLYFKSNYFNWMKYQRENKVLFQNYFMPSELYRLKRYRPGEWNYHLSMISDACSVLRMWDPSTYAFLLDMCQKYNLTSDTFFKVQKTLSAFIKSINNDWRNDWKRYIDLGRFVMYDLDIDHEAYSEDLKGWLLDTDRSRHYINDSEEQFLEEFGQSVEEILSEKVENNEFTVNEFLGMPHLWAVSGSAKGDVNAGVVVLDGKEVNLRKTKRSVAFTMSTSELRDIMEKEESGNYVFNKFEPGRNRPVVNSELNMYLNMAYLDDIVYKMVGHKFKQASPIFKDFNFFADKLYQVQRIGSRVCLPLDQKGFERQTSFGMIKKIIDVVKSRLQHDDYESHSVIDRIWKLINNSYLYYPQGKIDGLKILNGLSSGWKWTAFFNTIINLAEFVTCARMLKLEPGRDYKNLSALGDDTRVWLKNYRMAEQVLEWYESANIEINRKISMVSKTCDEFLRQVTEKQGDRCFSQGYANRLIPSILFRNPKNIESSNVIEELETTISNWTRLMGRVGNCDFMPYLESEVSFILKKYGHQSKYGVIHTPRLFGGFGVVPQRYSGDGLELETEIKELPSGMNQRFKQIRRQIVSKFNLPDKDYQPDRGFINTFFSENLQRKVTKIEIIHSQAEHVHIPKAKQRRAIGRLRHFAEDIINLINKFDFRTNKLPYLKGEFIPQARDRLSSVPFFNTMYYETPERERHTLFSQPELYIRLKQQLGGKMVDRMITKGANWVDHNNPLYDTDFYNLIATQFYNFWIDKRLNHYFTLEDMSVEVEKIMSHVMSEIKFNILP